MDFFGTQEEVEYVIYILRYGMALNGCVDIDSRDECVSTRTRNKIRNENTRNKLKLTLMMNEMKKIRLK